MKDNVQNKNHHFLLVRDDHKYVGFAAYEHNYHQKMIIRVHKIYLLPEMQGKGCGKMLMDHIAKIAVANTMFCLSLKVNRFNTALAFYQKLGFEIVQEVDIELEHEYLM